MSKALEKYQQRATAVNSMLCVGLDSNIDRLPQRFLKTDQPQFKFNQWIIDQTHKHVCAYKPNLAFYEARGVAGWKELKLTLEYLKSEYPDIFLIADAKRGDIGSTNQGYVQAVFDKLGFDAVTLNPYLGQEALQPFLDRADKVSIILCRTSNPGAGELQDLTANKQPLWQRLAENVVKKWNQNNNCMLVVGATCPKELVQVRKVAKHMPLLVPGIGAQGGDLQAVLAAGLDEKGKGLIINSSRSIIFANNPASEAKKLKDNINQFINNE